jgi:hypothetical protein
MIDPKALEAAARALAGALFTNIEADVRSRDMTDIEITALMDAALTAYHKHLAEAGLVIVPMEPTEVMQFEGGEMLHALAGSGHSFTSDALETYRAMIAAAKGEG